MLVYTANVGSHAAPITSRDAASTMLPDRHLADNRSIEIQMIGSALHDADRQFWDNEVENLRRHFATKVKERVDARDLSVFALAPQPLLIEFGNCSATSRVSMFSSFTASRRDGAGRRMAASFSSRSSARPARKDALHSSSRSARL